MYNDLFTLEEGMPSPVSNDQPALVLIRALERAAWVAEHVAPREPGNCLLYTSPSPRDS